MTKKRENALLNMGELVGSVGGARRSAPGPDIVHCRLLGRFLRVSLGLLLGIFGDVWVTCGMPSCCREALFVHVPNSGGP